MSARYHRVFRCVKCQRAHSFRVHMDSLGVCPYCGHSVPGTVTECTADVELLPAPPPSASWWQRLLSAFYGPER